MQKEKERRYAIILNYCTESKEIKDIAAILGVVETTAREYIRALIKGKRMVRIALNGKDGIYKTYDE